MPSRREQIAMPEADARSYLASARTLVLVTIGPDGMPDPVPMWFVLDGDGNPVMRTYRKSQKVRNVVRDPRAAALVEDGEAYAELRGVQLTGRVETFEDADEILDVAAALAVKYSGVSEEVAAHGREAARTGMERFTGLRFVAERVVSWDHAKLGGIY